MIRGRS